MSLHQIFDYLAIRLDGPAAAALGDFDLLWQVTDTGDDVGISISNGTMHAMVGRRPTAAVATIRAPRPVLDDRVASGDGIDVPLTAGDLQIDGAVDTVVELWAQMHPFKMFFPIVEPRADPR